MTNPRRIYATDSENSLVQENGPYRLLLSGGTTQGMGTTHDSEAKDVHQLEASELLQVSHMLTVEVQYNFSQLV